MRTAAAFIEFIVLRCEQRSRAARRTRVAPLCAIVLPMLIACTQPTVPPPPPPPPPAMAQAQQQPLELKVLTVESRPTRDAGEASPPAGLERDLVQLFADEIGATVNFDVEPTVEAVVPLVVQGRADFAAAGVAITPVTEKLLRFALPYQTVKQQVVASRGLASPKGFHDLVGKRVVVSAGSNEIALLQAAKKDYPSLQWRELPTADPLLPLQLVAQGEADAALTDSRYASLAANYYPRLRAVDSGPKLPIAWAFPKDGDISLLWQAQNFFARIAYDGTLARLVDRYYGHADNLDAADVQHLLQKMGTVLPRYRSFFQEGQRLTGIDWRLLAALAFQESHWDPLATSFAGVRGIMMLTDDTADRLKVTDRLDPKQAIPAGARYLAELRDQLPADVDEPDRTWMALAAYNMGYGHLNGARTIAPKEGVEPKWWNALKALLPKLSEPAYAARLKAGPARGGEAVRLVENVRTYYDILRRFQPPYEPGENLARH